MMQYILSIDTASQYCSVAVSINNQISQLKQESVQVHAAHILDMTDKLLAQSEINLAQLDAIIVNNGPGSFTGLRISLSVVQGLAYTYDIPVAGISSLASLTMQCEASDNSLIMPLIDARMQEIYGAIYEQINGVLITKLAPVVVSPIDMITTTQHYVDDQCIYCLGNGLGEYKKLPKLLVDSGMNVVIGDQQAVPDATNLLQFFYDQYVRFNLCETILMDAKLLAPQYIRNNVTS